MTHERIILIETSDERDIPVREPIPSTDTTTWAGTGPARGEWEAARPGNDVRADGVGPARREA